MLVDGCISVFAWLQMLEEPWQADCFRRAAGRVVQVVTGEAVLTLCGLLCSSSPLYCAIWAQVQSCLAQLRDCMLYVLGSAIDRYRAHSLNKV